MFLRRGLVTIFILVIFITLEILWLIFVQFLIDYSKNLR